jgi:hypothetical protein
MSTALRKEGRRRFCCALRVRWSTFVRGERESGRVPPPAPPTSGKCEGRNSVTGRANVLARAMTIFVLNRGAGMRCNCWGTNREDGVASRRGAGRLTGAGVGAAFPRSLNQGDVMEVMGYIGPETVLPLASVLAAVAGFFMILGKTAVRMVVNAVTFPFRRRRSDVLPSAGDAAGPDASTTPEPPRTPSA